MMAVTRNAALAVQRMTNTGTYPHAGLSIKKIDNHKFVFSIVPNPSAGDIAVPGTHVYLDRPAAAALAHATLDADANAALAGQLVLDRTPGKTVRRRRSSGHGLRATPQ